MSEEKKEKKPVPESPAAEKPAPKPHLVKDAAQPHGKKIGRMSLAELDEAIEHCRKQQGGLWSRYGQSLAGRKAALNSPASVHLKKAA